MRTSSFLIAILCLSACYIATDTNQCVKRAVDQMTEQGRRQVLALTKGASKELSLGRSLRASRSKNQDAWLATDNYWSSWGWARFSDKKQDLFGVYEQDGLSKKERAQVKVVLTRCLKLKFRCISGMRVPSCLSRKIKKQCAFYQVFWGKKLPKKRKPAKRKPSKKKGIKAGYMVYVRKALAIRGAYNRLRGQYIRIRTSIEKGKKNPSKKLVRKVQLMLRNLKKYKHPYQTDRIRAGQLYKVYVARMKKAHKKPARLTKLRNLPPLPTLPKDKNGHFMKIFLDESNRRLYYLYRTWANHYIYFYRFRWNELQGVKDQKQTYTQIYQHALFQLKANKRARGAAWKMKFYKKRINSYNAIIAKRTKIVQDHVKRIQDNLKKMREQFNNPEVDYLTKYWLFREYSTKYLHALKRFTYLKRRYFGYRNALRFRRRRYYAAYKESAKILQNEVRTYQKLINQFRTKRDQSHRELDRFFQKLSNRLKLRYELVMFNHYEERARIYAPLAHQMKRWLTQYNNYWIRTHRRNPSYKYFLGLFKEMTKVYGAELKSTMANTIRYKNGMERYFNDAGIWEKFFISWKLFRRFYWLKEYHTKLYLYEKTRYQAYSELLKKRRKPRYRWYRYNWQGWVEYARLRMGFNKKRLGMIGTSAEEYKKKMLTWYKKQSNYNKAYWMKRLVSRLQYNVVQEREGLKINKIQKNLRLELLRNSRGASATAQRIWLSYNDEIESYLTERLRKTKKDVNQFNNLSSVRGVKISRISQLTIVSDKYWFVRSAYNALWKRAQIEYSAVLREYNLHYRFRRSKNLRKFSSTFFRKARALINQSNLYRRAYYRTLRDAKNSDVEMSKLYIKYYAKKVPGDKKQLNKYNKLTAKYHSLAQHHPSNMGYRRLLKKYNNMKKLYVFKVAQLQKNIRYYTKKVSKGSSRRGRRLREAFVEDLELKGAATVEKLSEFSQILFKHVKEFSDRRDRRLILNCF